jgi:hypothetical protein
VDQAARGLIDPAVPMEQSSHPFSELFAQLGLPCTAQEIARFLTAHTPLSDSVRLPDAPFWTPSQAAFLQESLVQDSDWSGVVDQLNKALRGPE